MSIIACIPARLNSSRFPGKPMALLHGMPMIGHVFHRTRLCTTIDDLYIATCDQEIYDYIISEGGKAIMTKDSHEGCIDRCAEALFKIENERGEKIEAMTIIQGDEPMIHPEMISSATQALLSDPTVNLVNLMAPLVTKEEIHDPNEIKVVVDCNNHALYFSREPIPSRKKTKYIPTVYKQVCVIPFRRDFLVQFNQMDRTNLECIESIDMLRALENDYRVKMVPTKHRTLSVDTQQDLEKVSQLMENDSLMSQYLKNVSIS